MNPAIVATWEGRLTRLSSLLLAFAVLYGVIAGAGVTMYYGITPDMGAIEDRLAFPQFVLFLLAIILGFTHLPLTLADLVCGSWAQAAIRTVIVIGPISSSWERPVCSRICSSGSRLATPTVSTSCTIPFSPASPSR